MFKKKKQMYEQINVWIKFCAHHSANRLLSYTVLIMSVVCSVGDDDESLDDVKLASESDTFVSLISAEFSSFSFEVSSLVKFLDDNCWCVFWFSSLIWIGFR